MDLARLDRDRRSRADPISDDDLQTPRTVTIGLCALFLWLCLSAFCAFLWLTLLCASLRLT